MSTAPLDEEKLKSLFKAALIEVLEERKDLVRDLVEEAVEDFALTRAIDDSLQCDEQSDRSFMAQQGLAQAYDSGEPEYSLDLVKEPNPEYERR